MESPAVSAACSPPQGVLAFHLPLLFDGSPADGFAGELPCRAVPFLPFDPFDPAPFNPDRRCGGRFPFKVNHIPVVLASTGSLVPAMVACFWAKWAFFWGSGPSLFFPLFFFTILLGHRHAVELPAYCHFS